MLPNEFKNELTKTQDIDFVFDEPMKNHTSFKIGGPAEVFVSAETEEAFLNMLKLCRRYDVPFFVMGAGSNLLVSDKGIKGVVIRYGAKEVSYSDNVITAETGISLALLSRTALSLSLSGLEPLSGIPGLLGGALYMNAGAYGGEIKDVVFETKCVRPDGEIVILKKDDHKFGYRSSAFTKQELYALSSKLILKESKKEEISEAMLDFNKRRKDKQPLEYPSAGSTFKRPEGYFAAKLIEDAGLKGYTVGGAKVSEKHSGFVINIKDATAEDVLRLCDYVKETVYKKYGVTLEREVKLIGEF